MKRIIVNTILYGILMISAVGCLQSEEIQPKPIPAPTPEGLFAKKVWEEEILVEAKDAQKPSRVLDNFEIVQGIEFYPHEDPSISRRDSLIASIIRTISGTAGLVNVLEPSTLIAHAEKLKGSPLTSQEITKITDYANSMLSKPSKQNNNFSGSYNPLTNMQLFAFYESIKNCATVSDVVERMKQIKCLDLTYERIENADFSLYKKAIDSNIPVLLEKDNEYYIGYAYIIKEGKPYVFYFDPVFVPALKAKPDFRLSDLESNNKSHLSYSCEGLLDEEYYVNYRLSNMIPQINALEPFGESKFIFHFICCDRISYDAHTDKLRTILGQKTDVNNNVTYPNKSQSEFIWNKYFLNNKFTITGSSKLVPCTIVGSKNRQTEIDGLFYAMVSVMDSVGAYSATEFGWYLGSFFRFARKMMEMPFEYLPDIEVAALQKILDQKKSELVYPETLISKETSPYFRAVCRLSGLIEQKSFQKPNIADLMLQIAQKTGWVATAEGTKNATVDQYCESLHKNIPILLFGPKDINLNNQRWLICFGYYRDGSKTYLVLADIPGINGVLHITRDSSFPEEGVFYEEYTTGRYVSYFIYNWQLSDAGIRKEIAEVAANHSKYIEDQRQSEIDKNWSIFTSETTNEKEKNHAIVQLMILNDPRLKKLALEWINSSNIDRKRVFLAIGIICDNFMIEALPHVRKRLKDKDEGIRNKAYNDLWYMYKRIESIELKKYLYEMKNELIEAVKSTTAYKTGKGLPYEEKCREIKSIESWREDDPVAEPKKNKIKTNSPIDVETIKDELLYIDLQME